MRDQHANMQVYAHTSGGDILKVHTIGGGTSKVHTSGGGTLKVHK